VRGKVLHGWGREKSPQLREQKQREGTNGPSRHGGVTCRVPQGLRHVLGIFIKDLKTMVKSKGDKASVMQN